MMDNRKVEGFLCLERNLEATIHEGTVKLGFREGETISIYYDYELLVYLLKLANINRNDTNIIKESSNLDEINSNDIIPILNEFFKFIETNWGKVTVVLEKNRYKFTIPASGVKYVYEKNKDNTFLKDLIAKMNQKDCSVDSILTVFHKYSDEVICEKAYNSEFDYIIYFKDPKIDEFKYCFTFDEMGKYYHRLTYFDFDRL